MRMMNSELMEDNQNVLYSKCLLIFIKYVLTSLPHLLIYLLSIITKQSYIHIHTLPKKPN